MNLSTYQLTPSETALLSLGLNFCPTPVREPDNGILSQDLNNLHIRIQREQFFHNRNNDSLSTSTQTLEATNRFEPKGFKHHKFTNKSTWTPPANTNIGALIAANEKDLQDYITPSRGSKSNITKDQRTAIRQLSCNHNIVIKPADKGSAVVIQNITDYISEGERQLKDTTFYTPVDTCLTQIHHIEIGQFLDTMVAAGELSPECRSYLTSFTPKTP